MKNGKYKVTMDIQTAKFRIEGKGNRIYKNKKGESISHHFKKLNKTIQSLPLADYIEVGILNAKGEYLYLKKHKFSSIQNTIAIEVDELPAQVGIDPLHKLLDVRSWDNWGDLF